MCDVFPEVNRCCGCCTLRVGMLYIAVLAIMTGGIILSVLEHDCHTSFTEQMIAKKMLALKMAAMNLSSDSLIARQRHIQNLTFPRNMTLSDLQTITLNQMQKCKSTAGCSETSFFFRHLVDIITIAMTIHGSAFVVAGFFLMLANFTDEDGWAQVFVWLTFLNLILGTVSAFGLACDCIFREQRCIMDLDWLESAFYFTGSLFYYGLWFYFISVAGSYIANGDTANRFG